MTSTYAILATVELLHEYYTDSRSPDFSLGPDAATDAVLRGSGILSRTLGNALVLLAKVDESGVMDRPLPKSAALRFELNLEQPRMLNYTNLELPEGYCYLFGNRFLTGLGEEKHLNRPVPAYSTTADYPIAALVSRAGTVYEAILPVSRNDHAPGDTDYWDPRSAGQYVHRGDLVRRSDGRLQLSPSPARSFDIEVFAFNPATGATDIPAGTAQHQSFESPVSALGMDLTNLPTGLYRIRVNGEDFEYWLDREGSQARSLGVVELWNDQDPAGGFSLVDSAGRPAGTRFILRFANRLAVWKYRLRTDTATDVSIPGQPGAFVPGGAPREFISARPLPLRQQAVRNIQLMRGADILATRLANPPPERISMHTSAGNSWYCAEMMLNY